MHYLALLLGPESTSSPDPEEQAAGMAEYQAFHAKAASAIRAGRRARLVQWPGRGSRRPDAPTVTDGPFA